MRIWLDKTVDEEFEDLGTQGHTGTLNDRQFTFLATLSHTGSLADRMGSFIAGGRVVDTTAPVATSSSYTDATQTLTLNVVEASGTATCYWALVTNPSTPTEQQVVDGSGGGILEAGSFTVTSGGDTDVISVTNEAGNEIHLVIKDAAGNSTGTPSAGNNTVITGITVDSTAPSLSAATGAAATATTATVGVTSNEAGGTIFFAARISTDGVLSKANIENGTGDAVSTGTDATPTADANNTATLSGLTEGLTYIVDVFQRDAYGNESAVVSSSSWVNTVSASSESLEFVEHLGTGTNQTTTGTLSANGDYVVGVASDDSTTTATITVGAATVSGVKVSTFDSSRARTFFYLVTGATAGDAVNLVTDSSGRSKAVAVWKVENYTTTGEVTNSAANVSTPLAVTATDGMLVFFVACSVVPTTTPPSISGPTGFAQDGSTQGAASNVWIVAGSGRATAAGSYSVTPTDINPATADSACMYGLPEA